AWGRRHGYDIAEWIEGDVIRIVLRDAMSLSAAGIVTGGAGALIATRTIRGLLFGVQPGDPPTLFGHGADSLCRRNPCGMGAGSLRGVRRSDRVVASRVTRLWQNFPAERSRPICRSCAV